MFDWIPLSLAIAALALNLLLLSRHFTDSAAGLAGCGGGDCGEVLASRWAYVFRIPVTVLGAGAYLALVFTFRGSLSRWHVPLLGCIFGGTCWFLFVQAAILDRYCPWCLAAHGLALSMCAFAAIRLLRRREPAMTLRSAGAWAVAALLGMGLAQVYGPEPVTHRLGDVVSKPATEKKGSAERDLSELPLLGSPSATHVMVEYFDYQCAACRVLAGHLSALMLRHPEAIAVRLAPVPMDRLCNSSVPAVANKEGSCEIARAALAVWNHAPDRFAEFHRDLLADPSPDAARRAAGLLLGQEPAAEALAERRVIEVVRANIANWRDLSRQNPKLPKLLVRPGRILHGLPSSEESFIEVMEQELGLR